MKTSLINFQDYKTDIYVDKKIRKRLIIAKYFVNNKDWDRVYIIDGAEGSGKSLLALQLASFVDPTFNIGRVCFNGRAFTEAIENATKGQAIVFDEAFNGLASSAALSKMNKFIVGKLMECRQKNLFLFIVLPTFFMIQKYVAVFRSAALFHVFIKRDGSRGFYKLYNREAKKKLYLSGVKDYSYRYPRIKYIHDFGKKYPVDEQAYRALKKQTFESDETDNEIKDKYKMAVGILGNLLKERFSIPFSEQADILKSKSVKISYETLSLYAKKYG